MKTIRVIDLLNKIANKEEVPKKIKIGNTILINEYNALYKDLEGSYLIDYLWYNLSNLNDEIEIIEDTPKEDKKIEKLKLINEYVSIDFTKDKISYCAGFEDVVNKINEIIDKINGE